MRSRAGRSGWLLASAFALACWIELTPTPCPAGYLYMSDIFNPTFDDGRIERMNTDNLAVDTLVTTGGGLRGIACDLVNQKLYWTDVNAMAISWANLDGTGIAPIVTQGLAFPMDIDVHPAANLIAWGDATLEQIGTAHLDGSGAAPLLSTLFGAGIAFDQTNNKIYWTTATSTTAGEIRRCNLDGTNVQVIVSNFGRPSRIALDVAGGKIYWTDYVNDVVRRSNLDGTLRQTLYTVGSNLNPDGIALDLISGKVYWAQSYEDNREKIMRMNLDGTSPEDVLIGNFGLIADLVFLGGASDVADLPSAAGATLTSWPNPFTDRSTIRLNLRASGPVRLGVYAPDGRRVATFLDGVLSQGRHEVRWDGLDETGRAVPGGVYFYRVETGGRSGTSKVILAR